MGKEPWKRSWAAEKISENFLRLRHKLIPYLYSANYQTHTQGTPICAPMYYHYDCHDAMEAKNQYFFGSQLMVSPITQPADKQLNLASVNTWLPEGRWTDIFTDRIYEGGQWVYMHRDLDSIPVLAKEGTILPMYRSGDSNNLSLQQDLEIHIWRGNGSFELYEDDGETTAFEKGIYAITKFTLEETGSTLRLTITPPADSHGLLPRQRNMYIRFRDVMQEEMCITLANQPIVIDLQNVRHQKNAPVTELRNAILTRVQGKNLWKQRHFQKKLPDFLKKPFAELDCLWYPAEKQ
jgi:alpha-glucosidase (family GH31 glycosyl hydrolase)